MLFGSKKATVTAVAAGLIPAVVTLFVVLMSNYTSVPNEVIEAIAGVIVATMGLITASYNISQGYVDGQKARSEGPE